MIEDAHYDFINVNNLKIHVASMGTKTVKSPILLLHGFPEFHYSFRYLMPLLASQYRVFAIDQRGYNKSSRPKKIKHYSLPFLMKDVIEIIKTLSPSKKVYLVGHDWGGAIAWHVARYFPQFVEKLIILNCPPIDLLFKAILRNGRQFLRSYYIMLFQIPKIPEIFLKLNHFSFLQRILKSIQVKGDQMSETEMSNYLQCFNRPRGLSGINYYRAAFRDMIRKRFIPKIKVQCPTLILWGARDFALDISLTPDFEKYVEPNLMKKVLFPNAGHFIQQEIPEEIARHILNFL